MKKNLIFFVLGFVSLIASFVIFSCEKPANVTPISGEGEERSYIELFHSIDTYDTSFQEKTSLRNSCFLGGIFGK